ncbi:MAG TPA: glutamine--fructose-6-phosphate transaminase (isomerizing), partial [Gaiellaceae bacterium]|nr:glutamine--fructose-6-phosphate transaminase (isomerizing) [Gaiellaceae bacterium]
MCGIIGYVGERDCRPLLMQGLERLEYRGYDSAGLALWEEDGLDYVRAVGNLQFLKDASAGHGSQSHHGLGHTRWATHGAVTEQNAHPLTGCNDAKLAIVLNGIVENYRELKSQLIAEGHTFSSETDAEVIVHLLERYYDGDLAEAVRKTYAQLEGHFSFVVIAHDHPDLLVGVRRSTPLVVGVGEGEMFLASSVTAFMRETRRIKYLDDGDIVTVTPAGATFMRPDGEAIEKPIVEVDWDDEGAEKGGFETFMLKEIYEQPDAVEETIGDRVRHGKLELDELGLSDSEIKNLRRIVILSCGTSYHAGVVGRYVIEEWARIPVEPDIASEWKYRNPVLSKDTLVIAISQSGETRDTIEAIQLARESGAHTLAITNMMGTQIAREVDSVLYTRAGLEMAVASSKTFTAQVALLYLIALKLAQVRRTLPEAEIASLLEEVHGLPDKIQEFLDGDHPIEEIAQRHYDKPFFLYLGRHIGLPVCLEG